MSPPMIMVNDPSSGRSSQRADSPSSDPFSTPRSLTPLADPSYYPLHDDMTSRQSSVQYPSAPYTPGRIRSNPDLERYAENPGQGSTTDFLPLPYSGSGRDVTGDNNAEYSERLMSHSPRDSSGVNTPNVPPQGMGGAVGGGAYASDLSRAPSRAYSSSGADDEFNTQSVVEKFMILPDESMVLAPETVEPDDYLHNPDPADAKRDLNFWNRRAFWNMGGLLILLCGLLTLFIIYPVVSWVRQLVEKGPTDAELAAKDCLKNPLCIPGKGDVPLLKNVRSSLIDPDTPESAKKKTAADGTELHLVFSDEFKTEGRSFYPEDDPFFTAVDLHYAVTQDLEWYDPDAITTNNGTLEIRFDKYKNHNLDYRSGMLQSWNQLCFKGGRLEASISLPGKGDTIGFWPGFWTMGNLGRPGYAATTEGMWPYSYDNICDAGITPNQSSPDGISNLPGMKLPACTCKGEDHPTPGNSRSAPEIDVIEASAHQMSGAANAKTVGDVSQSFQIAPFDVFYMPDYDMVELYDPRITLMNSYTGGPLQQAMSGLTTLNNDWYDGNAYQIYAFEYKPGGDGEITWFVGEEKTWKIDAKAVRPNGNVGQRVVPEEPLALILNFGMSPSFAAGDEDQLKKLMPATMRVDYIRIYQDPKSKSVTCDPEGYETTKYIKKHKEPYTNVNLTSWEDTDFDWPENSLMNGCDAEKEPEGSKSDSN